MDTGLNNKSTLGNVNKLFNDVVFLVEATSTEQFYLWVEHSNQSDTNLTPFTNGALNDYKKQLNKSFFNDLLALNEKIHESQSRRVEWKQINEGILLQIGSIDDRPITISFSFAIIKGKKICFYYGASEIVCYKMIESWLKERFQLTHDNYTKWNHTDAMNFHNCLHSLDSRLDKEPKN